MGGEGKLIVISGPSGAGKSTIVRQVLKRTGAVFSVSATTRPARESETDQKEYKFVDRQSFKRMIAAGELLEWAEVFGELYGTPAGPVQDALAEGKTVILEIDVQGALQVHERMPQAVFVLIEAPNEEELAQRLGARGSETDVTLAKRLGQAKEEMDAALSSRVYNYRVVNDDLEAAVDQVVQIITEECVKE